MKTFQEFYQETYDILLEKYKTKEQLLQSTGGVIPDGKYAGNRGSKRGWGWRSVDSKVKRDLRRKSRKKPIEQGEYENYAKRNLMSNPKEIASIAYDREQSTKKRQENAAKRLTREKGINYSIDHPQPLSQRRRKPSLRNRFERISPGDVSHNRRVLKLKTNMEKLDVPPKLSSRKLTRASAISKGIKRAESFSRKLDKLISQIRKDE